LKASAISLEVSFIGGSAGCSPLWRIPPTSRWKAKQIVGGLIGVELIKKAGGIQVVEDGDLASATNVPPSAMDAFADLFCRFGPTRGLDYSLANNLYHLVLGAGFTDANLEIHQPAIIQGENRLFLKWSVEEAGPAFVDAGIVTSAELERTLSEMQKAVEDPNVLILAPRMSLVWARKTIG